MKLPSEIFSVDEVLPYISAHLCGPYRIVCGSDFLEFWRSQFEQEDNAEMNRASRAGLFPKLREFSGTQFTLEPIPYRYDEHGQLILTYLHVNTQLGRLTRVNPAWEAAPLEMVIAYDGTETLLLKTHRLP